MYKNYLFDLYGTLIDIETNEDSEVVWEKMALYFSYFGANYEAAELQEKYQAVVNKMVTTNSESTLFPEVDIEYVFYKLFNYKEVKPKKRMARDAAKVFRMLTTNCVDVFEDVVDMLAVLKSQKKNIYILANAQNVFALSELRKAGIRKFFDGFYISSDFGKCKPDQEFMESIFNTESLKKKESIIISADYERDIISAKELGVDALYLNVTMENIEPKTDCLYEIKGRNYREIIDLLVK